MRGETSIYAGPRYWYGMTMAFPAGQCAVNGMRGTEYEHSTRPFFGNPKQLTFTTRACISSDGLLLRINEDERVIFYLEKVVKQDVSSSMFALPPNAKIITNDEHIAYFNRHTTKAVCGMSGDGTGDALWCTSPPR
jgi:hypothetical protein